MPPPRCSWPCCWSAWPPRGWPTLRISPFKPLPQTLLVEGTEIVAERTSPIGLVQVVRSERIPFRSVTGLSLMNRQEPAPQLGLFVDGEGPTPITRFTGDWGPLAYLDATLAALPYRLHRPPARASSCSAWAAAPTCSSPCATPRAASTWSSRTAAWPICCGGELAGFAGRILDRPEVRLHVGTRAPVHGRGEAPTT